MEGLVVENTKGEVSLFLHVLENLATFPVRFPSRFVRESKCDPVNPRCTIKCGNIIDIVKPKQEFNKGTPTKNSILKDRFIN